MIEKKNGPLETVVALDEKEGISFVLWAITRCYVGDLPEPNKQNEKSTLEPRLNFGLGEVGPDQYFSPVFGPRNKK